MAKKSESVDLEKLKKAIAEAKSMAELADIMRDLEPEVRNKLTHQVYEQTNKIVLAVTG